MGANAVRWFEIYVQDMERARKFYEQVFEVSFEKLEPLTLGPGLEVCAFPISMQTCHGISGALWKMEGVPPRGERPIVYFRCDDCAVQAARVEKAGGKLHTGKMPIGQYGFIALGVDTEGNMVAMHSMS